MPRSRRYSLLLALALALLVLVQGGSARDGVNSVDIYSLSYHPSLISINAGESVTWFNFDQRRIHTIISDTGAFYSGPIYPGRFYAVHFTVPGTYPYHDNLYPSYMRGVVVVNPATTPTPPGPTPTPLPVSVANIAQDRPARASDAQNGFPPSAAFDGRSDTAWANLPTGSSGFAQWLQVDLGSEQTFNQASVQWGASYAQEYALFSWVNGRWIPFTGQQRSNGGQDILNFIPTRSRYVRLWLFSSTDLTGVFRVNEFALYNQTEAINLALDQTVVAQGYEGDDTPNRAVDGDLATQWSAPSGLPQFLSVNLQAPYSVERVVAHWAPDRVPPVVSLYGYDNSQWRLLDRRDTLGSLTQTFVLTETLTLSQITLQGEPNGPIAPPTAPPTVTLGIALRELEVYGRALSSTPPPPVPWLSALDAALPPD